MPLLIPIFLDSFVLKQLMAQAELFIDMQLKSSMKGFFKNMGDLIDILKAKDIANPIIHCNECPMCEEYQVLFSMGSRPDHMPVGYCYYAGISIYNTLDQFCRHSIRDVALVMQTRSDLLFADLEKNGSVTIHG